LFLYWPEIRELWVWPQYRQATFDPRLQQLTKIQSQSYLCLSWFILLLAGTVREKSNAFFVKQSFFSTDLFRLWSLEYPGVRGLGWSSHTNVKNLPRVGAEVCAKFGGDWSVSVLFVPFLIYTFTLLYFCTLIFKIFPTYIFI